MDMAQRATIKNADKMIFKLQSTPDGRLRLVDLQYDALLKADALILVTEWKPFRTPDYPAMRSIMRQPIIFDGRNQYDPSEVVAEGFEYSGVGRRG